MTAGLSPLAAKAPRTGSATHTAFLRLRDYLGSQIIGQAALVERLLIALLADGHLLRRRSARDSPRRAPSRRWRMRSMRTSSACSSRPTCCPPT